MVFCQGRESGPYRNVFHRIISFTNTADLSKNSVGIALHYVGFDCFAFHGRISNRTPGRISNRTFPSEDML